MRYSPQLRIYASWKQEIIDLGDICIRSAEYEELHGNNLFTLQTQLFPFVSSVKLLYLAKVCDPCVMRYPSHRVQIWLAAC